MKENKLNKNLKLHILICTNNKIEKGINSPSCAPTITRETFKKIQKWIKENNMENQILCTRTHCLGFCNKEGGVIIIHPNKKVITEIKNIDEIKEIISEYIKNLK